MMQSKWLLMLVVSMIVLTGCQPLAPNLESAEGTDQIQEVKLGVGFIPNVQFAPFYVGVDKGFYAKHGLDVSLDYGFENDYLALVGTNELQFMVGSGDQVVIGRAQGLPVRYVMKWYTQYPVVIFAKTEANITSPSDLAGRTIGIPGPFGASYVAFRGILEAAGLGENDVKLESIGFTQAAAISEGAVEAAVDYGVNGPVVLGEAGIETSQLKLDNYLQIPANGLVTNEETLNKNPALVTAMVQATMQAIQYTLDNPEEAFEISLKFVPEAGGDNIDANRAVFDASLDYWTPQGTDALGESRIDEWVSAAELIERIGLVDTLVEAESLFTNEYISSNAIK
ncbi:ABC transporter substrate-binding protein [Chloroflexi bacterium TSY]|nr:ABC transporter substrate-binding protein [Chloroflexi bacterium TSY]